MVQHFRSDTSHDFSDGQEKIKNISYGRFCEKSMFLTLTHCLLLAFSQWNLINLGVEVHRLISEIM